MKVIRRTFEALKHPKGSAERARLNLQSRTSEYMPSYRYELAEDNGERTPFAYRTKHEAKSAILAKAHRATSDMLEREREHARTAAVVTR